MNTPNVTWLYPAPSCPLPITHPARAVDLHHTDVAETFKRYADDYELTEWLAYLEQPGAFK